MPGLHRKKVKRQLFAFDPDHVFPSQPTKGQRALGQGLVREMFELIRFKEEMLADHIG